MKASTLYQQLETDFITPAMTDQWAQYMDEVEDFLCDNFKQRSMGLVCDFSREIKQVYTAVFPSFPVMQTVLEEGVEDALLFVHHPSIWDIRRSPQVFYQMDRDQLGQFRDRQLSIYNLHVPLDNYSDYSTSCTLARALGLQIESAFAPYFGGMAGVFTSTQCSAVSELKAKFEQALGHEAVLYDYGSPDIRDGRVAVVAGGGNDKDVLREIAEAGVNVFITGISARTQHSETAHEYARQQGISILGGTHYSTEKFACQAMVDYFKKLGLPARFIPDIPVMEDR